MISEPLLAHDVLVSYLKGQASREENKKIEELKQNDRSYDLLFHLIDNCNFRYPSESKTHEPTFRVSVETITRLLSGNYGKDEWSEFIGALARSQHFYSRVLQHLTYCTVDYAKTELPETLSSRMMSESELAAFAIDVSRQDSVKATLLQLLQEVKERASRAVEWLADLPIVAQGSIAIGAILVVFFIMSRDTLQSVYVYDHKLPSPVVVKLSTLRSTSPSYDNEAGFKLFTAQFNVALADYERLRYEDAAARFESMQSLVSMLQAELSKQTARDYYFYYGVTLFALSRSKTRDFTESQRGQHGQRSITLLNRALQIAASEDLERDREQYFSALALGHNGQRDQAIDQLQRIRHESSFFEKAQHLIKAWQ